MSQKRMFEIICDDCKKASTVPFEPRKDKPVYCKTCFSKYKAKRKEAPVLTKSLDMKNAWVTRRGN